MILVHVLNILLLSTQQQANPNLTTVWTDSVQSNQECLMSMPKVDGMCQLTIILEIDEKDHPVYCRNATSDIQGQQKIICIWKPKEVRMDK
jgi:hypothetical protein